jgi:hypothetical protein
MRISEILEANYWKADKTFRQKRLPTLEPDPVDNAERFDAAKHDQADDHGPEIDVNNAQMRAAITQLLLKLPPRLERILRERFFLDKTLEEIGAKYNISPGRIRQLEAKALRLLKHPSRSKQLKSMLQTSTQEAANPAQQAAIAINMKKHGKKPKDDMDEAKQRLDPKCWTGYHKAGTKMKGGIRVNNCVKDESINEFAPDEGPERDDGGKPEFMSWEDFVAAVANLTKSAFDVKIGFKNKKLNKTQAAAKFIPHDPFEFGPVSLYAFKDRRPPYRVGVRAHMQIGAYSKHGEQLLSQYKIPQNNLREVLMTPANATRIAHAIMQNTNGALKESVEESSGHIPKNEKEAHDPRWSNALTVDIGPGEDKKQAAKFGFKVSNSGPPKLRANGKF